jgi:uncharacterized protein YecE (DUF72 family)
MAVEYRVGTSGWHYQHWSGRFYPRELPKSAWLEFYSHRFSTVELNNSFYHLPSEATFAAWRKRSPEGFVFAVKVSRFITHIKRLGEADEAVDTFLVRARHLGGKLGPLLYQLPPGMKRDGDRLEQFLRILPGDVQHVFEFRNRSWLDDGVYELLRRYGAGFCVYHMPDFSTPVLATADFAYIRFHGAGEMYGGCYPDAELEEWAARIAGLKVSSVYVYFNNDIGGHAVRNAQTLARLLQGA